jgi:anthranilate phosphoribosyltransferase
MNTSALQSAIAAVESGENLSLQRMAETMGLIMDGGCKEAEIARLLKSLHDKGESVEEVAGAAAAMRQRMTPIRSNRHDLIDTCGTGGDGSKTFNISTAAALVTAAAGVPVAKHGNRGITSRSGSADVLAALGVNVEAGAVRVESCLDELGICFCFAPRLHKAMKNVAAARKRIGTPTIFNILGPLANPASAPFQLLGVGRAEMQPLMAEALLRLGIRRALVVHGSDGLDEVTLDGSTHVMEVASDRLRHFDWNPDDFGLEPAGREMMLVSDPDESAAIIRGIFEGRRGPPRDIVVANAAAALWTVGRSDSLPECAHQAAEAIDNGAAGDLLRRLVEQMAST